MVPGSSRALGAKPNRAYLRQRKVLVGERHPEYTLLSLTKLGVIVRDLTDNKGKFSADMGTSQEVRSGDLVMCLFDVPETPRTVGLSQHDGMITGAYTVFDVCNGEVAQWLEMFYIAMDDRKALSPLYSGLRNTIQKPRFLATKTPVPPPDEQAAIVRYLDHVDRRVRRLVRAKRKLIALLTEQKQAIIHRAVTRGLDPDVPLKDSGVEWLGEVPEHWEVRRAKYVFNCVDTRSETGAEELLTVSSRDGVVPRSEKTVTMFQAASYVGHKLCWPKDLVINSLWAWANGLGFSRYHGIVSTAYGVYRLRTEYRALWQYLNMALRSGAYDWDFQVRSKGIWKSRLQLTDWAFLDMSLAIPPADDAIAIRQHIEEATKDIDTAIARANREIELLREYQTRLTTDVVTGNLDVRDAAAALPEVDPLAEDDHADDLDADLDMAAGELDEALEEVDA